MRMLADDPRLQIVFARCGSLLSCTREREVERERGGVVGWVMAGCLRFGNWMLYEGVST